MHILICSTEQTNFDLCEVVKIVNSLQQFFVVWPCEEAIAFGDKFPGALIDPVALLQHSDAELAARNISKGDLTIILTSARVAVDPETGMSITGNTAVLTNQEWPEKGTLLVLRVARRILQLGFGKFVDHRSNVATCIATNGKRFDCLCYDCECQLQDRGFRDGIHNLKDAFNILNQLEAGGKTDLLPKKSNLLLGQLRLGSCYAEELKESVSLGAFTILVVLHFLSDLIPFVNALITLGAKAWNIYLVAKPYPYARRDEVSHSLQSLGVNVYRASKCQSIEACVDEVLNGLLQRSFSLGEKIMIIEDGGYFAPAIHKAELGSVRSRCVGAVEQTQKGADADKRIRDPKFPILSVAESSFKKAYESPEIGRVAIQNISRFTPDMKLSGGNALVVGFGSVGQEVAFHVTNAFNMTVSVIETNELRLLQAKHRKSIVAEAAASFDQLKFKRPKLVVGTTGRTSITREMLYALEGDAVLVSTSSDQVEIDLVALDSMADGPSVELEEGKRLYNVKWAEGRKQLTLLAEGYPINFYGSESVPNDTIDPVMTLLLLCAVELASKPFLRLGVQEGVVDEIVKERDLVRRFLKLS
ncbi:MAG: hypothetical protein ACREIF_02210 [Chthoniobacterales bacterium]